MDRERQLPGYSALDRDANGPLRFELPVSEAVSSMSPITFDLLLGIALQSRRGNRGFQRLLDVFLQDSHDHIIRRVGTYLGVPCTSERGFVRPLWVEILYDVFTISLGRMVRRVFVCPRAVELIECSSVAYYLWTFVNERMPADIEVP